MKLEIYCHGHPYLMMGHASHPIAPRSGTLAVLLLVAGRSQPPRRALPTHRITAHSNATNYRF